MFALLVLTAAGVAAAQTQQTPPPADQAPPAEQAPSSSAPDQQAAPQSQSEQQAAPQSQEASPSSGANSASSAGDKKTQMKACVKQERANNSGMSRKDAKAACEKQLSGSPQN
ncbi:MAG TPA: hypothetical protein VN882_08525 [Steroidobacteraceae bacterium]|nr:hypothetical protein [Steroidobacteraceae bacterium]